MLHRSTVLAVGGYQAIFGAAEDLELWSRVADHHLILALPEPLMYYRIHISSMSFTRFLERRRSMRWIEARQYARWHGLPESSLEEYLAVEQQFPWHRPGLLQSPDHLEIKHTFRRYDGDAASVIRRKGV
jgi:hypothetical protein